MGWPYVWGGESRAEGGFDCSGLIDYAYTAAGLPLPGRPTAADLWHLAAPEPPDALAPGDLVFVGAASGAPHHVGMYVGGGTVVVAPHTGAARPLRAPRRRRLGRLRPPARGRRRAARRPTRRSSGPRAPTRCRRTSSPRSSTSASRPTPTRPPSALAAAQRRHPGDLQAALADALGDASLARGRSAARLRPRARGRRRDGPAAAARRSGAAGGSPNGDARGAAAGAARGRRRRPKLARAPACSRSSPAPSTSPATSRRRAAS